MSVPQLSLTAARHLHLAAQGLLKKPRRRARPADILTTIQRMSLLQIDTINIVARSPYMVLFSRLGDYSPSWLDEALRRGELMEYWAHEACFLPREDFSLVRHRMLAPENMGWKYRAAWMDEHADEIEQLIAHIHENGPVRSADFDHPRKGSSGWWAWKPHKRHLENLFSAGELMVVERRNFQRVYDLRSRVMPHWRDEQHALSENEAVMQMLEHSARSLGIFRASWLADYYRLKRAPIALWLAQAAEQGVIQRVEVEQLGEMWLHHTLLPQLAQPQAATHSALLSPFDPVVWDRRRALELFNFDYRIECYTPEHKRKYGYFVLPLLHRGVLKGRVDAKMDRQAQSLILRAFWLEPGVRLSQQFLADVHKAIDRFAAWQGASEVVLENAPDALRAAWSTHWHVSI